MSEKITFDETINTDNFGVVKWKRIDEKRQQELLALWNKHKDFIINTMNVKNGFRDTNRIICVFKNTFKDKELIRAFRAYENEFSDDFCEGYIKGVFDFFEHSVIIVKARLYNGKVFAEFIDYECRKSLMEMEILL